MPENVPRRWAGKVRDVGKADASWILDSGNDYSSKADLNYWLDRGMSYAASLPPK